MFEFYFKRKNRFAILRETPGEPAGGGGGAPAAAAAAPAGAASYPAHTPAPAAAPAAGATPPAVPEFASLVPEAFKDKPWVKETKDLPTLFKRVDDLQSELGKRPSAIPQDNAKPEEWAAFNKAFGVPEKPEGYEFGALPDGLSTDPEWQKNIQGMLHKANISAKQFKAIEPAWNAMMLEMSKKNQAGAEALDRDFDKIATTTFGERKTKVLSQAKALVDKYTPAHLRNHVAQMSNENLILHAAILDGIIKDYISEDQLPGGGDGGSGPAGEQARRDEAMKLMQSDAFKNAFDPKHDETVKKVNALYASR